MTEYRPCPGCGAPSERDDSITNGVEGAVRCTECSFCALVSDWDRRKEEADNEFYPHR